MKIYFTASVSHAKPENRELYNKIVSILETLGHTVIARHIQHKDAEIITHQSDKEAASVQSKMSKWRKQAALLVAETSTPSFGVGQEIAEALADNRQVLALYLAGKKPNILTHQGRDLLYLVEYTPENLQAQLTEYIEFAKTNSDTRFNFFISPQIGTYLDWVSHKKKLPRAVYLRRLIEEDMTANTDYQNS
jgi:2'-deoxynucleoside 5'-phosphate N-hydrolase